MCLIVFIQSESLRFRKVLRIERKQLLNQKFLSFTLRNKVSEKFRFTMYDSKVHYGREYGISAMTVLDMIFEG